MPSAAQAAQARRKAESLMTDRCIVRRRVPGDVLNEETGQYEPTFVTVFTGPCRIKSNSAAVSENNYEAQIVIEQQMSLSLPLEGSAGVAPGDVAELTESAMDPDSVGKTFRIAGVSLATFATARRFPVEVTS